jgi:hypothetical protein
MVGAVDVILNVSEDWVAVFDIIHTICRSEACPRRGRYIRHMF